MRTVDRYLFFITTSGFPAIYVKYVAQFLCGGKNLPIFFSNVMTVS